MDFNQKERDKAVENIKENYFIPKANREFLPGQTVEDKFSNKWRVLDVTRDIYFVQAIDSEYTGYTKAFPWFELFKENNTEVITGLDKFSSCIKKYKVNTGGNIVNNILSNEFYFGVRDFSVQYCKGTSDEILKRLFFSRGLFEMVFVEHKTETLIDKRYELLSEEGAFSGEVIYQVVIDYFLGKLQFEGKFFHDLCGRHRTKFLEAQVKITVISEEEKELFTEYLSF